MPDMSRLDRAGARLRQCLSMRCWLVSFLPALWAAPLAAGALDAERAVDDTSGLWSRIDTGLSLEAEFRHFPRPANDDAQHGDYASLAIEPTLEADWDNRDQAFTLSLFGRLDRYDNRRSHADVREAFYRYTTRDFEWRIGMRKVFWGVTESAHLVDVINQTDFVEDIDRESKLGQPMVNLAWFSGVGTFNFFLLPEFRERTFPAEDGRPRPLLPVATHDAAFPDGERMDVAMRYYESIGAWDIGVSLFHGTSREPRFDVAYDNCRAEVSFTTGISPISASCEQANGISPPSQPLPIESIRVTVDDPNFVPVYERIDQAGLDLQYVNGGLALKLEAIRRWSDTESFTAAIGGLEYTLYNILGTDYSLGLLAEYLYDSRGQLSPDLASAAAGLARDGSLAFDGVADVQRFQDSLRPQSAAAFQDDLFVGTRLALNDLAGTEMLLGLIRDLESGAVTGSLEASRRVGGSSRLGLTARLFSDLPVTDPQYGYRDDDYVEVTLTHFF